MLQFFDPNISNSIAELADAIYKLNERDNYDYLSLLLPTVISLLSVVCAYFFGRQEFNRHKSYEREYNKRKVYLESMYKLFKIMRLIIDDLEILNSLNKVQENFYKSDINLEVFNKTENLLFEIMLDFELNGFYSEKKEANTILFELVKWHRAVTNPEEKLFNIEGIKNNIIVYLDNLSTIMDVKISKWNNEK